MDELQLVRLHEDGEHLVLGDAGGARFVLPISETLRAAVRRDRPHLEHLRAEDARRLSPREIQSRLRAGEGVEEVADAAGLAVEQVRRFAGPVLAEQEYVVERVRASRPGHEDDAATVDELTAQRLTARDVDLAGVRWSAARQPGAPWVVTVAFTVASGRCTARWSYDASSRALHPLDDEARWITQPDPAPQPAADVFDVDSAAPRRAPRRVPEPDGTADMLDDLGRRRGVRRRSEPARPATGPDVDGQEPFEGFGPLSMLHGDGDHGDAHGDADRDTGSDEGTGHIGDHDRAGTDEPRGGATVVRLPSVRPGPHPAATTHPAGTGLAERDGRGPAHPAARRGDDASDVPSRGARGTVPQESADDDTADATNAPDASRAASRETRRSRGRSRAKVPSWDEIVFGARPEH